MEEYGARVTSQKIIPHLWFDKEAEEAAKFYTSVFNNGKIHHTTYYTEAGHDIHGMDAGTALTVEFEIENMQFVALNGGPHFTPNPAISFIISRNSEEEINALWEKLSDGGTPLMPLDSYPFSKRYGWIQDRYGFSWQLILPQAGGESRPGLIPSLLFVGNNCGKAEEAINFYISVFQNSKKGITVRYPAGKEPDEKGTLMYADFTLDRQYFAAMDSALEHNFTFSEAISFMVRCDTQQEIDYFWEKLSSKQEAEQCGWLKDKYGVSWQIVPEDLDKMLKNPDKEKANRVMEELLKMKKLDIGKLEQAYKNK